MAVITISRHPGSLGDTVARAIAERLQYRIVERDELVRLAELGLTVVYVTHRVSEARRLGGRAVILVEGAVEEAGDTEAVLAQSRSAKVKSFLHGETAPEERPT